MWCTEDFNNFIICKVYKIFLSVKIQVPKLVIDLLKIMVVTLKVTEDLVDDIVADTMPTMRKNMAQWGAWHR